VKLCGIAALAYGRASAAASEPSHMETSLGGKGKGHDKAGGEADAKADSNADGSANGSPQTESKKADTPDEFMAGADSGFSTVLEFVQNHVSVYKSPTNGDLQTEVNSNNGCYKLNSEGWSKYRLKADEFYYVNIGKALVAQPVHFSDPSSLTVMDLVSEKVAVWTLYTPDMVSDDDDPMSYKPESLQKELKKNEDAIRELDGYEWATEGLQMDEESFFWIVPQGRYEVPLLRLV